MKKSLTISVVILTNDRPQLLKRALISIKKQTVSPLEVITVDDSSALRRETRAVIRQYVSTLPIIKRNTQHSISYGRTVGFQAAHGDIIVYLDDDCAATPSYLVSMLRHFTKDPHLTAVVGRIKNSLPDNVFAATQYAYYDRGLRRFFPNLTSVQPLTWGRILDCEVMGIRKDTLTEFGFADRNRWYRNDDVELGLNLTNAGKRVIFDPRIVAFATPRTALSPLWTAAFWNGYSDAATEKVHRINLRLAPYPSYFPSWFIREVLSKHHFPFVKKLVYAATLLSFPTVSRLGRLWYHLTHIV